MEKPTTIFDLPQEVRDMIYAYFPYLAAIHINQDPALVLQPNVSKVNHRMREESLDVFYGRNKFILDLRGWKHGSYPRTWTPFEVFEHWMTGIGDHNAAKIRSLMFVSHNFRLIVKVSHEVPPTVVLRLRTNAGKTELAEHIPFWYTFEMAAERAEKGLQEVLENIQAEPKKHALTVNDFLAIAEAVDDIQPFLCRRMTLGYQGTALLDDDMPMDAWPDSTAHKERCSDCGYWRHSRSST